MTVEGSLSKLKINLQELQLHVECLLGCLDVSSSHWSSSPSLLPSLNPRSEDACVLLEPPRQSFLCCVVSLLALCVA